MTTPAPSPLHVLTERMLLRPLEPRDRAHHLVFMDRNHEHLRPWQPASAPASTPDSRFDTALERSSAAVATGRELRLFAFDRARPQAGFVGWFNLNNVARGVFQNAYAGWALGHDHVGRGLACEGVRALLDIAFTSPPHGMGLHRVQANIMPGNARSIRVAERCGFTREGLCRKYLEIAGNWEDHLMYAALAPEHPRGTAELPESLPDVLTR